MALSEYHFKWFCQLSHGLLLLLFLWLTVSYHQRPPLNSWVPVKAQVIDATVVQKIENKTIQSVLDGFWVQYVYQYIWQGEAYISRGLILQSKQNQSQLTSNEMRVAILTEQAQAPQGLSVWVNPDAPNQSALAQPVNHFIYYWALGGLLTLFSWSFWSFRLGR